MVALCRPGACCFACLLHFPQSGYGRLGSIATRPSWVPKGEIFYTVTGRPGPTLNHGKTIWPLPSVVSIDLKRRVLILGGMQIHDQKYPCSLSKQHRKAIERRGKDCKVVSVLFSWTTC